MISLNYYYCRLQHISASVSASVSAFLADGGVIVICCVLRKKAVYSDL
jgi:hypothetical protein